jgi:hypothetical protein
MERISIYMFGLILCHTTVILCMDGAAAANAVIATDVKVAVTSQDNAEPKILSPEQKYGSISPKDSVTRRLQIQSQSKNKLFDDGNYPAGQSYKSTFPLPPSPKSIVATILASQSSDQTSQ